MDWTVVGVLVAVVALVSGWYWWWKPLKSKDRNSGLGNVDLGKASESGRVTSNVETTETTAHNAGNIRLGIGAKSKDIETKVTVQKSK